MVSIRICGFSVALASCAGSADIPQEPVVDPAPLVVPIDAGALKACKSEVIPLPSDFAPTLPPGSETLWFAPGMFDPSANDYFTYQFVLGFETPQEVTVQRLEVILLDYYAGLMSSVAEAKQREHAAGATSVLVQPSATDYATFRCGTRECLDSVKFFEASLTTVDEFATGQALHLKVVMAVTPDQIAAHVVPDERWNAASPELSLPCAVTAP
jgi:hypothetical protein